MTPVIVLSDSTLANGAEPWKLPVLDDLPDLRCHQEPPPKDDFKPYRRDPATLARAWVTPGQKGYEYRIGGLEKDALTGNVSYDPMNHERMTELREAKILGISADIPDAKVESGPASGQLLVVGWGSSYGPIREAVERLNARSIAVSHLHLMHLNPFPRNLGELLTRFEKILVPELNRGQLSQLLAARYRVEVRSYNKMQGRPLTVSEIEEQILAQLED